MAKTPKDPAPSRIPVREYVTPDIRDVLFYINVNSDLPDYEEPAYGSPFNGVVDTYEKFPNHKLVYVYKVSPASDHGGGWVRWYFAADRDAQGAYNIQYADGGISGDFDKYTRTYIIPRADFADLHGDLSDWINKEEWDNQEIFLGDENTGDGALLSAGDKDPDHGFNPELVGFVYTGSVVKRVDDKEIDSLYIQLTRTFERLCPKRSFILNPITGKLDPVMTKIVLRADAKVSDIDPDTGEYTSVEDLNCIWSNEVTKLHSEIAAKDVELVGEEYNPLKCDFFISTNKIVPAGTKAKPPNADGIYTTITPINVHISRETTHLDRDASMKGVPLTGEEYNDLKCEKFTTSSKIVDAGTAAKEPDSSGVYTTVTPISKCLSRETTHLDKNASMKGVEMSGSEYNNQSCKTFDTTSKIVKSGTKAKEPDDKGVYTTVTPISKCLSRETSHIDSNAAMKNIALTNKVFDAGTVTVKELKEVIKGNTEAEAKEPEVSGESSTGIYKEVQAVTACLSKEVERVDPNWSMLQKKIATLKYNEQICDYVELESYIAETTDEIAKLKSRKPTKDEPYFYDVTPINAKLSRVSKKVDVNWAMVGITLKGGKYNEVDGNVYPSEVTIIEAKDMPDVGGGNLGGADPITGMVTEYVPINACLVRRISRRARPVMDMTYYSTMKYTLPAVFSHFDTMLWGRLDEDGAPAGSVATATPVYASEQETRDFPIRVERSWSENRPNVGATTLIQPTRIQIHIPPFQVTYSIPPALHNSGYVEANITGNFKGWDKVSNKISYPATVPPAIPKEIVISDQVSPSAGGFLRVKITLITGR